MARCVCKSRWKAYCGSGIWKWLAGLKASQWSSKLCFTWETDPGGLWIQGMEPTKREQQTHAIKRSRGSVIGVLVEDRESIWQDMVLGTKSGVLGFTLLPPFLGPAHVQDIVMEIKW